MTLKLLERPESRPTAEIQHECATCGHKKRVYLSAPTGQQTAAVWRCGLLSQKTQREVLVQPHENCFEHRSLSDHWEKSSLELVR
jgi:hypothetical protein